MRAFILGNSGELLDHDLSHLKGEVVFASNAFPLREPDLITHYVLMDIGMAFVPEVRALVPSTARKYYSRLVWNTIYQEQGVLVYDTHPDHIMGFALSDSMLYSGRNVSYAALQIATYLGFNPIYTLGVDLGLPANGISHIPEQETLRQMFREKNLANPTVDKRLPAPSFEAQKKDLQRQFIYAKAELDSLGVSVINLSRGGNLNCFPRESYEELFNHQEEPHVL